MNNSSLANSTGESAGSLLFYVSGFNVIGLLLNTLVISIVCRRNVIPGKVPRAFLLNQLVSEWLCCLVRSLAWLTDQEFSVPDNGLGTFICKLFFKGWLYFGLMHTSYSNIILLTVERYVMVVHPMRHKKFTPLVTGFSIFLCWATGFGRLVEQYLATGRSGTSCINEPVDLKIEDIYLLLWSVVLPIIAIACLNGRVIYVLKQQAMKMNTHASTNAALTNPNVALRQRLQKQMTYSVAIVCLAYAVTVIPIATVHTMMAFGAMEENLRSPLYIGMTYVSSMFYLINPLVCIFLVQSVRRQVVAMFSCGQRNDDANEHGTKSTGTNINTVSTAVKMDDPIILGVL